MNEMTRWEVLEEWLFDNAPEHFTNIELAESLGVERTEASLIIKAYLANQRSPRSNTLFVLKRESGRTTTAIWTVGHRVIDAQKIGGMLFEDVRTKVLRAFEPDLRKLAERNPPAGRYVSSMLDAVIEGALRVFAASVDYRQE